MTSGTEMEPKVPPLEVSLDGVRVILELRALLELEALESPAVEILELFRPKSPMVKTTEIFSFQSLRGFSGDSGGGNQSCGGPVSWA